MKKLLTLYVLLAYLGSNAQCPAPSNLTLSIPYPTAAQLSWTENGTASVWEIAIIPDYVIGDPLPTVGVYYFGSVPYMINGLPQTYSCYVFFVRSVCSPNVSSWAAVGSPECSTEVYNYLATLSINNQNLKNDTLQVYPNPSDGIYYFNLADESNDAQLNIFNLLGEQVYKGLLIGNQENQIDLSNLAKGCYLVKLSNSTGTTTQKLIKN